MNNIANNFIKVAVLFALTGMALGIHMAITGNHNQPQAHAHINLVGWVTLMLFGLYYKCFPEAGTGKLALAHFWLSTLGAITINVGVYIIYAGTPEADPVAAIGSIAVILGMLAFAINVFSHGSQTEA